jgi:Uma2 family endonuclease
MIFCPNGAKSPSRNADSAISHGAIMATVPSEDIQTFADLLDQLGGIAPKRVRLHPIPAGESDLLDLHAREGRLYELVDGILVEKAMGFKESCLAVALQAYLLAFVKPRKLGLVAGEAGMLRLRLSLVRIPDVSFISWQRIPNRCMPTEPIPALAPDLAVEILSEGNTKAEMARKVEDYLAAAVALVWIVDPDARTVTVHRAATEPIVLTANESLDGGDVLPGFSLPLAELFAELDQQGAPRGTSPEDSHPPT